MVLRDASKRNLLIFVALVAAVLCGSQLIGYVRLSRREIQAQAERSGAAGTPAREGAAELPTSTVRLTLTVHVQVTQRLGIQAWRMSLDSQT